MLKSRPRAAAKTGHLPPRGTELLDPLREDPHPAEQLARRRAGLVRSGGPGRFDDVQREAAGRVVQQFGLGSRRTSDR